MRVVDDLVAFLRARLDEDEAAAKSQADWLREYEKRPGDWARFMFDPLIGPFGGQSPLRDVARGLYVGRTADPDRVLREVEAKRAILAEHEPVCAGILPCDTLKALAGVYSDHPDYRQEWKP